MAEWVIDMGEIGLLLVISGPSGVGKGCVCQGLIAQDPNTAYSVSATTRAPRPGEVDGVNYFFLSREDFLARRAQDAFLEWAEVYGNYYGTPAAEVEKLRNEGKNVILEIDTQGAMQIKAACPGCVSIFIMPPSLTELRQRIVGRGTEDEASLRLRLSKAEAEIKQAGQYDYRIVNDDLPQAITALAKIIRCERAQRKEEQC